MNDDNPFMDVEANALRVLGEDLIVNTGSVKYYMDNTLDDSDRAVVVKNIFVKEKAAIVFYIQELIRYAAKSSDINVDNLIPAASENTERVIKSHKESI